MKQKAIEIAVAVVEHQGEYLVAQRPEGALLAGFWEFPGGKVEPRESASMAARRECREEAGLDIEILGEYQDECFDYEHGRLHLRFFSAIPQEPMPTTAGRFIWCKRAELAELRFPPANARLIQRLLAQE
ncbi:MAG TPA: (deoxy)nucleoside triphosphate pyrophosphohydrolase [Pirellulales bacterium]|jgi:8-oxo-dGTP diphosphatase|nr:(deoxy)nucleoside triphosphate pyrophosphohydrolase [Pirellulales bacterium]